MSATKSIDAKSSEPTALNVLTPRDHLSLAINPDVRVAPEHQREVMQTLLSFRDALTPRVAALAKKLPEARVERIFDLTRREAQALPKPAAQESPRGNRIEVRFVPNGTFSIEALGRLLDAAADAYSAELEQIENELSEGASPATRPAVHVRIDLSQLIVTEDDELMVELVSVPPPVAKTSRKASEAPRSPIPSPPPPLPVRPTGLANGATSHAARSG